VEQPVSHLSDDDLVLHYYGEDGPETVVVERHLQSCAQCAQAYEVLTRTLHAVTPPGFVDAPDDTLTLRELLRAQVRGSDSPAAASLPWWRSEPGAIALAWLVPVLYPWSLPALFRSAQWAQQEIAGIALTVVMLLWACAGPLAAVLVLHGVGDRFDRVSTRLRVLGAVMAAVSPPLFLLMRGGQRLSWWYLALGASAVLALVPWPDLSGPPARLRSVHRLSAALLGVFVLAHIVNQSLAFISVPSYAAMRSVMQGASQQSISYAVIVTAASMQIVTGAAMSLEKVRAGAFARNLQAVSGWYLAVFLLSHVFAGFLLSRPAGVPFTAASLTPPYVLATASVIAQLPYYLLGVAAFLVHIGVYARLAALAYLAESSVRRLSYAAAFAGAMVVVTVGLSLCGIHVLP
jgi:succinate dehydrogenase/fumarate reductase cytochrome b subunit